MFLNDEQQWHIKNDEPLGEKLKTAILLYEDRRFYSHFGVDLRAIVRSFYHNLTHSKRSGASTITMQTIKLLRRDSRTYHNKFRELIFALRLESLYSKDEILQLYTNNAPYGGNIVGVRSAALYYFGKKTSELSWGQAALLAVLPNAPGFMHLQKNTPKLLAKRDNLLKKLHKQGIISDDNLKLALNERLPSIKREKNIAPHLALRLARDSHIANCGDSKNTRDSSDSHATRGDSKDSSAQNPPNIYSTIDKTLQIRLESALKRYHQNLLNLGIQNAAAIIVDTRSREVLAYGGSQDFFDIEGFGQIDGIVAKRSVGSVLKPLLYALAIDNGLIVPQSKLIDAPTMWVNFKPQNANKKHYGLISARLALIRSLNVPFVGLLQDYGYERFFYDLKNILDFEDENFERYGLSLILGTKELSVEDVAKIYAGLGNYGVFGDLKYVRDSWDSSDSTKSANSAESSVESVESHEFDSIIIENRANFTESMESRDAKIAQDSHDSPREKRLISAGASYLTLEALRHLDRLGIENFYKNQKVFSWKSGTSYGRKDAWAAGTSPRYTIVVWAGNFDGSANPNLFGVNIAGDLLFSILGELGDLGEFARPEGEFKNIKIDAVSGYLWDAQFSGIKSLEVPYPRGAKPLRKSPFLKNVFVDKNGALVSSKSAEFLDAKAVTRLELPINLLEYYRTQNRSIKRVSPFDGIAKTTRTRRNLAILYPKNNIKITLTKDFEGANALIARIANLDGGVIFWYLDGEFIGSGAKNVRELRLNSGAHTLTIISENGESDSVDFVVF